MTISLEQYFGKYAKSKDLTPARYANARRLLNAVNRLELLAISEGVVFPVNPKTGSGVSGDTYGGFRPQDCPQGASHSAHKDCEAVDRYDPFNKIDDWLITSPEARKLYEEMGMYFEHPKATLGWSHWSIRRPASGNRFFYP